MVDSRRLHLDVPNGDLGTMRRRLYGTIHDLGYAPKIIEQIAELSWMMGDYYEAGRWFFIIDSNHDRAQEMIDAYIRLCGSPRQAASRAPLKTRLALITDLPEVVRTRLAETGTVLPPKPARPRAHKQRLRDKAAGLGCIAVFILFFACALTGLVTIINAIIR